MIQRMLVSASVLLFVSATSAVAGPPPAAGVPACRCATSPDALLEQVDHIFVGDIIEVKGDGETAATAIIRVRETFKGDLAGVVEVRDAVATDCAWSVFEMAGPGRYVIFANDDEGELVTPGYCPQTQPFNGWKDRLAPFRAYARTRRGSTTTASKPARVAEPAPKPTS